MDIVHRVLSGQSASRVELIGAGLFVLSWWAMDAIQFVYWLTGN